MCPLRISKEESETDKGEEGIFKLWKCEICYETLAAPILDIGTGIPWHHYRSNPQFHDCIRKVLHDRHIPYEYPDLPKIKPEKEVSQGTSDSKLPTPIRIKQAKLAARIAQASALPRDAFNPKSRKQNTHRRPRPRDTRDSDFNKRAKAAKKAKIGPAKF